MILNNLDVTPTSEENVTIKRNPTDNTEAWKLYMQGRQLWDRRDKSMLSAIEYYEQAVKLDPNYALAYAGMADAYNLSGFYGYMSPKDAIPKAKKVIENALKIDDKLAAAYASRAFINLFYDWDWEETEKNCLKALELDSEFRAQHHSGSQRPASA